MRHKHNPFRLPLALIAFCGLVLVGGRSASAQTAGPRELPPELKRFAEDCDTLRRGRIIKIEEALRGLRSGQMRPSDVGGTRQQLEADLAALKARSRVVVPTLHFPVSAGNMGRLPGTGGYVEQIVGPEEALVKCTFRVQVVVTRHYKQVAEIVKQQVLFKVRGISTAEMSTGNDVELLQPFRVAAAERYRTADGQSASVLVLQPVDMQPIENYLRSKPAP